RRRILDEIGEGLGVVLRNPLLRSIAACTGMVNLFSHGGSAVFVLYATRELGIRPALLGVIFSTSNVGVLVGAMFASRVARRLGLGATLIGSIAMAGVSSFLIPLAGRLPAAAVPMLIAAQALVSLGGVTYNINQVSLRQAVTPDRLQGRMNATMRFLVWGTIPIGALLGGALGGQIGCRPTLLI